MIAADILKALEGYTENLECHVNFVVQTGEHDKREELLSFLNQVVTVSDKLSLEQRDMNGQLRGPISFLLERDGDDTGIRFTGIPSGHEFNSLVLAVLHAGGTAMKMDSAVQTIVRGVDKPLHFEVFVSLSCHNCPDVVQTLNQFALLNDHISTEMIDGGLYQDVVEERDIQGVPSVYLNGELFANGKVDAAMLLDTLMERYPELKEQVSEHALPIQDVTIIGGGPAGVSAAIYSARKGLKVTLIADRLGGQVKDTMGIENLISVPKTTGPELVGALQNHMNDYDVTLKENVRADAVSERGHLKSVILSTGERIETKTLIVTSGARWRELGVPGEKENIGNGVAYCPHCDGPFFKGKDVAVIGGGNSGIEAALDLAGITKSVKVFEFLPELKADQVLIDKAVSTHNVEILVNVATKKINATNGKVSSISYEDRATGELHDVELAGVFVQIGLLPNSQFIQDYVDTSAHGEILIDEKCRTSVPGVFAAGDVTNVPYKQIVIALGEGSKASLAAFEYLLTEYSEPKMTSSAAA
ncbi:MAG: alkyl hydroperoxide reductase subunit F [Pseudomonadota bacterium]